MPVLTDADPAAIAQARERGYTWIDLTDPDDAAIDALAEALTLHPLAVEDTKEFHQRPKVEAYDDFVLAVLYGSAGDELVETHLFAGDGWTATVRRGRCAALEHLHAGPVDSTIGLRILDALTDTFFGALDGLDGDLERLEDAIVAGRGTRTARQEILDLRRATAGPRRVLPAERDALDRGAADFARFQHPEDGDMHYDLRDVQDHLQHLAGRADGARERLHQDLDMAENAQSARLNEIGERLTLITVVFLPLTFVTGFFGMNFRWMTDHIETLGAFVLGAGGGCAISIGVLLTIFRRKHWLG